MKILKKRDIPELLFLGCFIGGTQIAHRFSTTQKLINFSKAATSLIPKIIEADDEKLAHLERWSNRISNRIPGSHCLHRAVGLNLLLGFEGIASEVVVGFRKRDTIEGHAWLEVTVRGNSHILFSSVDEGFRSTWIPS